jgi:spore coat protein B
MNKEILSSLVGKAVKVNRGGHDSRIGQLLEVEEDYFVLLTKEDGVLYYKGHHVKSLTNNLKKGLDFNLTIPEDFTYIGGNCFKEVLCNLKYHWVTLNRGGHEKYEGVMDDVNDEYITMVSNEEVIRVAMFHIRNISYDMKVEDSDEEKDKKENKEKNENKSE